MSPRPRQNTLARNSLPGQGKAALQHILRTSPGLLNSTPYASEMSGSQFSSQSCDRKSYNDGASVWSCNTDKYSASDDSQYSPMDMDPLVLSDASYMLPVTSSDCYDSSALYALSSSGAMSQTLTAPLAEHSYPETLLGDDLMQSASFPVTFSGYNPLGQYTWRHGQLSPPCDVFLQDDDFSMDPSCDLTFAALPEAATTGNIAYEKMAPTSASRQSQPRPIRSASERTSPYQPTLVSSNAQLSRDERNDKVKARNDPRYERGPDRDGYYHCPMIKEGSCNHKPTKQKCIYAKYLDSHLKPYVCKHGAGKECEGARFSSNACLFRHEREAHGMHNHGMNPYLCLFKGCERARKDNGFPRRWNQRDHMKRVHEWEEPDASNDSDERYPSMELTRKRKGSGSSHSVQMKRSSSSHAKAQAATYAHGSRHSTSRPRYDAQACNIMAYPVSVSEVQYAQMPAYQQSHRTSEAHQIPNFLQVAY